VCGALAQLGRVDLKTDLPEVDRVVDGVVQPITTTTESICARLLSGDANADKEPDDLNGNDVPDYEELRQALAGSGGGGGGVTLPGLPTIPGAGR
jgi:hypothetical protein